MERTGFEQWKPREVARLLALVETERRYYQEMMAVLPAALVVLAQDRTILSANMAFRRLAGLSGEELRKRRIEQVLPSDELVECLRAAHVHGDTAAFFVNLPFEVPVGSRSFRMVAVPIRGWEDDMEPETLVLIQETDSQQREAPLTKAAEPFVPVPVPEPALDLNTLPAAVWQADASSFAFTYAGGAAEEILGYPAAHWLAEPQFFSQRIHPDDRAEVMELYRSIAATGGEASAEFRALSASNAPTWCRETIRVPAPGVGSRHIAGVLTGIGERRQLEAQSLAAARVDALRGLSSRLAHDLNNPLMIVTGYGEELMNTFTEGDARREDLAEVMAASGRLSELATHLLNFTRPQAKTPAKIDLSALVAGLAPKLGVPKPAQGVDLNITSPGGEVWTFADPEQLEEAIAALAAFAIENTSGVTRLNLTCHTGRIAERVGHATLQSGVYARLDIQAEGVGSGAAAAGVFESILPNKDLNKPAGPAVSRAYLNVRQWGGDIAFSSGTEQGSIFAIYLLYAEPVAKATSEAAPAQEPEQPVVAPPVEFPPVEPEPVQAPAIEPSLGTVLVVEDEPGIRGLVRKILKRERFEVIEAGTGEEAITAAASHGPGIGLLLTDVMLPGVGGRELAEKFRAADPNLKVVYISGFTDDESVRTGEFPPGSLFLQKPFTLSALVGIVKQAFELR